MLDADDDEKTRLRSATPSRAIGAEARVPGLPPPLVPAADTAEDEPTQLFGATLSPQTSWLVAEGQNAPRELDKEALLAAIKHGDVSEKAFVWQEGMHEWQRISAAAEFKAAFETAAPSRGSKTATRPLPPRPSTSPAPVRAEAAPQPKPIPREAELPSILLSSSVSTADFSLVDAAEREAARIQPSPPSPETTLEHQLAEADSGPLAAPEPARPRPAAGRPPVPGEPVATARDTPPRVLEASAGMLYTGEAQAALTPKIAAHREVTEPARTRPPLLPTSSSKPAPSLVLWLLGAGGWVVAGVLGGILIARSPDGPAPTGASTDFERGPAALAPARAHAPRAAKARVLDAARANTAAPGLPGARPAPDAPGIAAEERPELPSLAPATVAPRPPIRIAPPAPMSPPVASSRPSPAAIEAVPAAAPAPQAPPAPAGNDIVNSPGF